VRRGSTSARSAGGCGGRPRTSPLGKPPSCTSDRTPPSLPDRLSVSAVYGVWKEKNLYGKRSMGVGRTTLVIDQDGVVRKGFPKVKVGGRSEAVLEAIRGL